VTRHADQAAKPVGVLALQGDVAEHLRALAAVGAAGMAVRRPEQLEEIGGLIIPGGESTTIWKLAVAFDLMEPITKAVEAGLPAFGCCAGMIMLADRMTGGTGGQETFGGIDMTVRRNAFGRQVDSFESDIELRGIAGPPLRAVFIRAPWVEQTGPGVEILGADTRTGRIVAVRQGVRLATAFHPELTPDLRLHQLFKDIVREQS
jgi:5'-phosphate synthase pdxT subunit